VNGLPDGFITDVISSVKAIKGRFAPNPSAEDGRPMLLVVSKEGEVHVLEDVESTDGDDGRKILDLTDTMCTNGERGLQSIEIHPQFGTTNTWVYLYYNKLEEGCLEDSTDGPRNVLVRYTMNDQTLELEDEEVLLSGPPMGKSVHNGGALLFGNDGYLYLTLGDGGNRYHANDLTNLHGSLLRLNDDGSVPQDNPFVDDGVPCGQSDGQVPSDASEGVVCSEIFAYGFRNPFRMARYDRGVDTTGDGTSSTTATTTTKFVISDVGAEHWEELSWGGADYKGKNYGWPEFEGPCETGTTDSCSGHDGDDSDIVDPFHFYQHVSASNGGCVGGAAYVPASLWPEEYEFLFIDFIMLKIYNLIEDSEGECRDECSPPTSGFQNETFYESIQEDGENVNEARMTDMFFGPYQDTQALYIIKFGNHDTVLRIRYTGNVNKPPVPQIVISNNDHGDDHILVGHLITLDGSESSDLDGDELTYEWDFGDGSSSTEVSPTHAFVQPGEYVVTLIVTDTDDQAQQMSVTVTVGQPPTATILSPVEGVEFFVGEVLKLSGEAKDYLGNSILNEQLRWEVRRHHAEHFHPFLDEKAGNNLDLYPAPEPEDFFASTNSFLRIIMYATDENGLTTEVSRDVQPRLVPVEVTTVPIGLDVIVHNSIVETPSQITSWARFKLPLSVEDQPPYIFQSWSDGNTNRSRYVQLLNESSDPQVEAIFCLMKDTNCSVAAACCTGYCSSGGSCTVEPLDVTAYPSSAPSMIQYEGNVTDGADGGIGIVINGTNTGVLNITVNLPPEDDVGTRPDPNDPFGAGIPVFETSSEKKAQSSSVVGEGGEMSTGLRWILSLFIFVSFGIIFFVLYRKWKQEKEERSRATTGSSFGDCLTRFRRPSIPSTMFRTPTKKASEVSNTTPETYFSTAAADLSTFTGSIWEKLAEENDRRAKLRERWSRSPESATTTDISSPSMVRTPETAEHTPDSSSGFPQLKSSIDEAFVRLDDLLSRTFSTRRSVSRNDHDPATEGERAPLADEDPRIVFDLRNHDVVLHKDVEDYSSAPDENNENRPVVRHPPVSSSGNNEDDLETQPSKGSGCRHDEEETHFMSQSADVDTVASTTLSDEGGQSLPPQDMTIGSLLPPPPPPPQGGIHQTSRSLVVSENDTLDLSSLDVEYGATTHILVEEEKVIPSPNNVCGDGGGVESLPTASELLDPPRGDFVAYTQETPSLLSSEGLVDPADCYLRMELGGLVNSSMASSEIYNDD
jgi:PKD repeat protein